MKDYWKTKQNIVPLSFLTERYTSQDIDCQSIKGRKERSGREEDKIRIIVINSTFLSCHCFEVSYLKDHFLFLTKRGPSFTCQLGVCVGKHQRHAPALTAGDIWSDLGGRLTGQKGRRCTVEFWGCCSPTGWPWTNNYRHISLYCASQIPFFF